MAEKKVKKRIIKKTTAKKKSKKTNKPEKLKTAFEQLSVDDQRFVRAMVAHCGNQRRAYKEVHPNAKDVSADVSASRLLKKDKVKQAVNEEFAKIWAEKDKEIEKGKTYQMIHVIADASLEDVVTVEENGAVKVKKLEDIPPEVRGAIQAIEYEEKESKSGGIDRNIKVKMHSKTTALRLRAEVQNIINNKIEIPLDIVIKPAVRPDKKDDGGGGEEG